MKNFMIPLVCFLLGLGVSWGYFRYQEIIRENDRLKTTEKNIPASAANEFLTPTPVDNRGQITGKLGYPSEVIPPLTIYAFDTLNKNKFYFIETAENQTGFTIPNVDPSSYFIVAYTKTGNFSGSYTKAVPCGLAVECTDHSMIDVIVRPGEKVAGVEVRDWYAPENTFPKKPL